MKESAGTARTGVYCSTSREVKVMEERLKQEHARSGLMKNDLCREFVCPLSGVLNI